MKKFILQLGSFLFILFFIIEVASYCTKKELDPNNYLSAIIDKHMRLETVESPKIVIIGDSSLVFGLDAKKVEMVLKKPVVNMGLHAALGLEYIFKEVMANIKTGDVVVFVYHYYPSSADINDGVLCHVFDFYPLVKEQIDMNGIAAIKYNYVCKIKKIRRFLLNYFMGQSQTEITSSTFDYKRWAFTDYGDVRSELYSSSSLNFKTSQIISFDENQIDTMKNLEHFGNIINSRGAKLLVIYPPFPENTFQLNREKIENYGNLINSIPSVIVGNSPYDSVMSNEYFFNSDYHLTSVGKGIYTDRFIKILKNNYE